MVLRSAALLGLALAVLAPSDTSAGFGLRLGAEGLLQGAQLEASSPNVAIDDDGFGLAAGASVVLDLPFLGLRLGGLAAYHLGNADVSTDPSLTEGPDAHLDVDATFELHGPEFGGFVETHIPLASWSRQDPYIGVGGSYARIELDGALKTTAGAITTSELTGGADVYRVYAVGGSNVVGNVGFCARAGWSFHEGMPLAAEGLRSTGSPARAQVTWEGLFVTVGLVLRLD